MMATFIAEAGVNHNGDVSLAFELIDVALEAQADIVKFQLFDSGELASKTAPRAAYQIVNTGKHGSQREMLKGLELKKTDYIALSKYCSSCDIEFLSTAFDVDSLKFLVDLGIRRVKIPSGELVNPSLLKFAGGSDLPVILSTGMSDLAEITSAIDVLQDSGASDITLLQCHTDYPTDYRNTNLRAMVSMGGLFNCKYGFSDHTLGGEAALAAVALGSSIIEKHFTINKGLAGPDHAASLDPNELKALINSLRNVELAMGEPLKRPSKTELQNRKIVRRSIVAKTRIRPGEEFTHENLCFKRPGTGLSPMMIDQVVGNRSPTFFDVDEEIFL